MNIIKGITIISSERKDGPMNNVGHEEFDRERRNNRQRFIQKHAKVLGIASERDIFLPYIVHGSSIACIGSANGGGKVEIVADAVITSATGLVVALPFADCPPVVAYDRITGTLAVMHCGWKPIVAGIIQKTINKMKMEYNVDPRNIQIYIGPRICPAHYEVGGEVARQFGGTYESMKETQKTHLSLRFEIIERLEIAGVQRDAIQSSNDCTYHTLEENEPKYSSWRRQRSDPLRGNMLFVKIDGR